MNTQNVKTAATKTTETWVKQNFDVHLSMRTNRRVSLAKLEGDLMKHRAMQKLGVDTEELFDDLQLAVACITTMIDRGDIVTPSGYELASTMHRFEDVEKCIAELGIDLVIAGHRNRFMGQLTSGSLEYVNHLNIDVLITHLPR